MDIYHIYCDTKPGVRDLVFCDKLRAYLDHLAGGGLIAGFRITRAKLGFGLRGMGDWHIMLEVRDLVQLEAAFRHVAGRAGAVEGLHHGVNALAANAVFALTRDFPDAVRQTGEERF